MCIHSYIISEGTPEIEQHQVDKGITRHNFEAEHKFMYFLRVKIALRTACRLVFSQAVGP